MELLNLLSLLVTEFVCSLEFKFFPLFISSGFQGFLCFSRTYILSLYVEFENFLFIARVISVLNVSITFSDFSSNKLSSLYSVPYKTAFHCWFHCSMEC